MDLKKNDLIDLEITGYTAQGSGVGRYQDIAVFVPLAAKGDRLRVKILKTAKTYAFGRIDQIIEASKERIALDCAQFAQCGGCVYRHIEYSAELKAKQQMVRDALERIGGFRDIALQPIVGAKDPDHYRNKAQIPIGRGPDGAIRMGFFASHSHRIIPCEECLLQPAEFTAAMNAFQQWANQSGEAVYEEETGKGRLRHLYLRKANATGEVMVCVVVNGNGLYHEPELVEILKEKVPGLKSVIINVNREKTNVILGKKCRTVWGSDTITDTLCGLHFRISPMSFYQVNRDQAERLYTLAGEYAGLTGKETLLDLYCGTGTIGLSMAKNAAKVIGVEIVEQAVEDAKKNAQENQIDNAEFFCADAAKAASMLKNRGERPDVVVIDPPRKGCDASLIETIAEMAPQRVVYVSCDPATLARDLKLFAQKGYAPQEATPVDMFPRTAHTEAVCLLEHEKSIDK
ncbi:23S rRNA (uracil(1939)-C(5))-methyltransferase RlmD [Caproiciproducens galactitolivorans]|uniref:23S rRNA (Uracil(1939)-C(5))-methyltransferase RlmD n=1 Tax=Caproiciproducens galactitolivorans TaxID=642589 RepID=A0ABT4BR44_9FIRM|nr:23S rRNA (uracil(1939)-C(5))-methyltransferase RlmD [Caproiciproducens galactitolivorans]MCY1713279.1 23S rRNA (uracil(1939)-C(5))-methyltransferase RlmD [Caproiciproducens galactitolivorans]